MKFLDDIDADDPVLSVVNLIDVFLVVIAALLITVARNPMLQVMQSENVTVITDPGEPGMQLMIKRGDQVERFRSNGQAGEGMGTRAGVAYRMRDGSVVYVPESGENGDSASNAGSL